MLNKAKAWGRDRGPWGEAETKARALRSRPRPISWGRGQAEAKDEVTNKKQQLLMTTHGWIYRPIIMIKMAHLISHSLLHSNYLLSPDRLQVCSKRTSSCLLILGCWFFCCRPRPSRSQMFKAEAEAKALRPRPRPNFWPRDHFGLEDLTSLVCYPRNWCYFFYFCLDWITFIILLVQFVLWCTH